jgi:upstream activation factor subunit UAF30
VKRESTPVTDESDVDLGPPKKKRKQPDSDAKLAAKLQAEENSRARPSRGSVNKKPIAVRKKPTPKKKSSAKVKADDDSDLELNSDGEKKEVVRKGGFHVSPDSQSSIIRQH